MLPTRGTVGYSRHLLHFATRARIGLHDATVIERRDTTRGLGLFLKDSCDAGTSLMVVPNNQVVTSSTLQARGVSYPFFDEVQGSIQTQGLIRTLLRCPRDDEWVELAWRICLERSCGHSFWWGWLDGLPTVAELSSQYDGCSSAVSAKFPTLMKSWREIQHLINNEIDVWYDAITRTLLAPSRQWFKWAVLVVLSRASSVVQPQANGSLEERLGIVPLIDSINTSNTYFIQHFDEGLRSFVSKLNQQDAIHFDALAPNYLQLLSKDNAYFYTQSSDARQSKLLTLGKASQIPLANAEVEVAFSWEDLPQWYQDSILSEALEGPQKDTVGMLSVAPARLPLHHPALNALFPAFVVSLTRSCSAGSEVLVPYEEFTPIQSCSDSAANRALSIWARYGFMS